MTKRIPFILISVFAILVGLYPFLYFFVERNFGLLQSKEAFLLSSTAWNIGFYTHIILGGLALLAGWPQFVSKWRDNKPNIHRTIGKFYVGFVMASSLAGIYIGWFATGGIIPAAGFISLGLVWFFTTLTAYRYIRNGKVDEHQHMMIYSYAACFAAVMLRIYLPILTSVFGDFLPAYKIVAWLCWVPNMIVAYFIVRNIKKKAETNITTN